MVNPQRGNQVAQGNTNNAPDAYGRGERHVWGRIGHAVASDLVDGHLPDPLGLCFVLAQGAIVTPARIAATALLLTAAGCFGESQRTDGPVQFGAMSGAMCLPAKSSHDFLFGTNVATNTAKGGVDVTALTLDRATNIQLIEGFITPISGNDIFPSSTTWPVDLSRFDPLVAPDWARREAAIGPSRMSGVTTIGWNVVLHLVTTGANAGLKDFSLHYKWGGHEYSAASRISLAIRAPCTNEF